MIMLLSMLEGRGRSVVGMCDTRGCRVSLKIGGNDLCLDTMMGC